MAAPARGPQPRLQARQLDPSAMQGSIVIHRGGSSSQVTVSSQLKGEALALASKVQCFVKMHEGGPTQGVDHQSFRVNMTKRTVTFTKNGQEVTQTLAEAIRKAKPTLSSEKVREKVAEFGKEMDAVLKKVKTDAKLIGVALGGESQIIPGCPGTAGTALPFVAKESTVDAFVDAHLKAAFKKIDSDKSLNPGQKLGRKKVIVKRLTYIKRLHQNMHAVTSTALSTKRVELTMLESVSATDEEIEAAKREIEKLIKLNDSYSAPNMLALCIAATELPSDAFETKTAEELRQVGKTLKTSTLEHPALKKLTDSQKKRFASQMRLMARNTKSDHALLAMKVCTEEGIQMPRVCFATQFAPDMLRFACDLNRSSDPTQTHEEFFATAPTLTLGSESVDLGDALREAMLHTIDGLQADYDAIDAMKKIDVSTTKAKLKDLQTPYKPDFPEPGQARTDLVVGVGASPAPAPPRFPKLAAYPHTPTDQRSRASLRRGPSSDQSRPRQRVSGAPGRGGAGSADRQGRRGRGRSLTPRSLGSRALDPSRPRQRVSGAPGRGGAGSADKSRSPGRRIPASRRAVARRGRWRRQGSSWGTQGTG